MSEKIYEVAISDFTPSVMDPRKDIDACDVSGKVRIHRFQATLATETNKILLGRLPAGHSVFLGQMSLLEVIRPAETPKASKLTFSVGFGAFHEPMGETRAPKKDAFVKNKDLQVLQSLIGSLEDLKLMSTGMVDILLTTSAPLDKGTVVRGYLAYSHD